MQYIVALAPIVTLFVLMLGFRLSGHLSALLTLAFTAVLALFAAPEAGMVPQEYAADSIFSLVGWSMAEGVLKAFFPIFLIILMAIFSYNILVESRQIERITHPGAYSCHRRPCTASEQFS